MTQSDKYEFIRELGHGASGSVYLVKHRTLNLFRAVKIISKHSLNADHILREALIIKNIKYQGIPIIYDIDETSDSYYIYEEYVEGKTLTAYLQAKTPPLPDIIKMVSALCSIIAYLHCYEKGILHLDIKPDNIIIDNNGRLWLIDYDNATTIGDTSFSPRGTEGFAPPQAYFGNTPDVSWDIYSLGMIILYMSNGTIHSNVCNVRHQQLIPIIKKCVHHAPFMRYRNVAALKADLEKLINKKSDGFKNNSKENISLKINVGGTDRGVGTTHFCLSFCSFLNRCGVPAVVVNANRVEAYSTLCTHVAVKNNTNINVINIKQTSFYNNLEKYRVIIYDYGDFNAPDGLDILVCSSLKPFYELNLSEISHKEQLFLIWNLCDTKYFYDNTRHLSSTVFNYRMPCVYDFNNDSDLSRNMFEALCNDMNAGLELGKKRQKFWWKGRV